MAPTSIGSIRMNRCLLFFLASLFATGACAQAGEVRAERVNSIGMRLMPIPAGKFWMGSDEAEIRMLIEKSGKAKHEAVFRRESPRHRVRITKPFYLGRTSVTI